MRGNFTSGRRPSLKKRLESMRRQNRAIAEQDHANRCATCRAPLTTPSFQRMGSALRWCSAICMPPEAS